jgi:hypothetical protein
MSVAGGKIDGMNNPTTTLDAITEQLADVLGPRMLAGLSEDELLGVLAAAERAGRRIDALRVLTAGEVAEQSRNELGKSGLAARKGCRNSAELIERVTQVSGDTPGSGSKPAAPCAPACRFPGNACPRSSNPSPRPSPMGPSGWTVPMPSFRD